MLPVISPFSISFPNICLKSASPHLSFTSPHLSFLVLHRPHDKSWDPKCLWHFMNCGKRWGYSFVISPIAPRSSSHRTSSTSTAMAAVVLWRKPRGRMTSPLTSWDARGRSDQRNMEVLWHVFCECIGSIFCNSSWNKGKSRVGIFWTWCDNWVLYI